MKPTLLLAFLALGGTLGAQTIQSPPKPKTPTPEWVPDPSAGHYDCPDGWIAYSRSEPFKPFYGPVTAVYHAPNTDKKGHVLEDRPPVPICVQEQKP